MLGWVHQPAGTWAGSPGRAVGGPGSLGHGANVKSDRNWGEGGDRLWEKAGLGGFGHTGLREVKGHLSGSAWLWASLLDGKLFKPVSKGL